MRKAKANSFDEGNRQAAQIILADPKKYPGLPTEWARLWVANHPEAGRKPARSEQAPPAKPRTRAATQGGLL